LNLSANVPVEINLAVKIGYCGGNFGKNLLWASLDYLLLFFLTEMWGIAPALAGLIILISLLWDGLSNIIMAALIERQSRSPSYRRFLLICSPLCAISFCSLFTNPGFGGTSLIIYVLFSNILFRTCYTFCDVPHNAMMAQITTDSRDASLISGLRFFFSSMAGLSVALAAGLIFASPEISAQQTRFITLAISASIIFAVTLWISWAATAKIEPPRTIPDERWQFSFRNSCMLMWRNEPLRTMLAASFIQTVSITVFSGAIVYFANYVVNDGTWASAALFATMIAQLASVPFWIWLGSRWNKRATMMLAYSLFAIGLFGFFAFAIAEPTFRIALMATIGVAFCGINIIIWAMLPDVIDYGEWQSGQRLEALPVGMFLLVRKCASGGGAALLGLLLTFAGYTGGSTIGADFSDRLVALMTIVPLAGLVCCAVILVQYRLSHAMHHQINADLNQRSS
jgi:glycoside/pentoside/hexuronide:cation symporter, GPH family